MYLWVEGTEDETSVYDFEWLKQADKGVSDLSL